MNVEWKSMETLGLSNYKVSNDGRVCNVKRGNELKGSIQKGYRIFLLTNDNKKCITYRVHRLVALMFLGSPKTKDLSLDHIDRNKLNNNVKNLRWATAQEQCANKNIRIMRSRQVLQYNLENKLIKVWKSGKDAGKTLNISASQIWACCNGKISTSGGFKWKYQETVVNSETWKTVDKEKFDNVKVSDMGRVKIGSKIPIIGHDRCGYLAVGLNCKISGKRKTVMVHRLVADTFLGPDENLVVNHKNGKKLDNRLANLEFVTKQQNSAHAHKTGLIDSTKKFKPVVRIDPSTDEITGYYKSVKQATIENNILGHGISGVCMGRLKRYKGYKWAHASQPDIKSKLDKFLEKSSIQVEACETKCELIQANYDDPVVRIDPKENIVIGYYNCIRSAEDLYDIRKGQIAKVLTGKQKTTGGYAWSYINKEIQPLLDDYNNLSDARKIQLLSLQSKTHSVPVVSLDIKTNQIVGYYKSFVEAAKDKNIHPSCIQNVCKGKQQTSAGFKWCCVNKFDKNLLEIYAKKNNIKLT